MVEIKEKKEVAVIPPHLFYHFTDGRIIGHSIKETLDILEVLYGKEDQRRMVEFLKEILLQAVDKHRIGLSKIIEEFERRIQKGEIFHTYPRIYYYVNNLKETEIFKITALGMVIIDNEDIVYVAKLTRGNEEARLIYFYDAERKMVQDFIYEEKPNYWENSRFSSVGIGTDWEKEKIYEKLFNFPLEVEEIDYFIKFLKENNLLKERKKTKDNVEKKEKKKKRKRFWFF